MTPFRPKYITFDCYGTLTNFRWPSAARALRQRKLERRWRNSSRIRGYRLDEVLGDWKPYDEVVHNAVERTCKNNGVLPAPKTREYL